MPVILVKPDRDVGVALKNGVNEFTVPDKATFWAVAPPPELVALPLKEPGLAPERRTYTVVVLSAPPVYGILRVEVNVPPEVREYSKPVTAATEIFPVAGLKLLPDTV